MAQQETDAGQSLQTIPASSLVLSGSINDAVNLAQLMAKAKVALPKHLHNNPGECLAIVMIAQTWGMNPYMVGAKTSVINDRLMYEGQLVNAVINRSTLLQERLWFDLEGEGEAMKVTVTGLIRGESKPRSITLGMPKPGEARNSPLWKTQPDQQLCYKGCRVWARRYIPEVLLGVYTPEDDFSEMPEVKEARAKSVAAIENRVCMLATSPIPALDAEVLEEIERGNNSRDDVFTAGAGAPLPAQTKEQNVADLGIKARQIIDQKHTELEAEIAKQNQEAAGTELPSADALLKPQPYANLKPIDLKKATGKAVAVMDSLSPQDAAKRRQTWIDFDGPGLLAALDKAGLRTERIRLEGVAPPPF